MNTTVNYRAWAKQLQYDKDIDELSPRLYVAWWLVNLTDPDSPHQPAWRRMAAGCLLDEFLETKVLKKLAASLQPSSQQQFKETHHAFNVP